MSRLKFLLLLCILSSCLQNNVKKVRIVDAQGNPAKINKIVPKFNEEQMKKQKESLKDTDNSSSIKFVNENNGIMQQINDPNIITSRNDLPNDEVFADRITNFNYVEDKNNQIVSKNEQGNKKIVNVYDNTNKSNNKNLVKEISVKDNNKTKKIDNNVIKGTKYFIQIGIFSEKSNAEAAYSKYSRIYNGIIDDYLSKGKNKYKVLLGPYTDKKIAEKDLEKIIKMGHYDVYITEKK
ncbi:MAG TPA: SPOR domain-containing protein [Rickettsiales bacterium]|nr:SPOR domain-containing protein [Rickettsiales bacterium]